MITSRNEDEEAYLGNGSACYQSDLLRAAKHTRLHKAALDAHIPSFFCV